MLQAVHNGQIAAPVEPVEGESALGGFAPFLRLALDESALLGSIAALPAARGGVVEALRPDSQRFSAAGHWAKESLARAQGQSLGVNLAEIAAGELTSSAEPGAATAEPAPERQPAVRWTEDAGSGRQHRGRAPGGEAGRGSAEGPIDADADDGESAPVAQGGDRSAGPGAGRGYAGGKAGAAAPVVEAAGGPSAGGSPSAPGAAPSLGQVQSSSGPISPVSASAWKLESAARAASAGRAPGAGGAAQGQSAERALQSQMERGLGAVLRQGGGSLTLKLAPASLGEVRIHLTLKHGSVRARFEAPSSEARELMTAGLGALRAALEARGLRVESLEVAQDPPDRAVAEPPRAEPSPPQPRHTSEQGGGDGGRGEYGGRSAAEDQKEGGGDASPRDDAGVGGGESKSALEDPAIMHAAGEPSETLVSLRLDTVA